MGHKKALPCETVDDFNLYPPHHPAMVGLCSFTAAAVDVCSTYRKSIKLNVGRKHFIRLSIGFSIDNNNNDKRCGGFQYKSMNPSSLLGMSCHVIMEGKCQISDK